MGINDLAQWAAIIVLATTILGMLRQVGHMLSPEPERRAERYGPDIGDRLPVAAFAPEEGTAFMASVEEAPSKRGLVLFVNPMCDACEAWIEDLARLEIGKRLPVLVLSTGEHPDLTPRLAGSGTLASDKLTATHIQDFNLRATPMVVVVDDAMRAVSKQLSGNLEDALRECGGDEIVSELASAGTLQVSEV